MSAIKFWATRDVVMGNDIVAWTQAAIVFVVTFVVLFLIKVVFAARYRKMRAITTDRLTPRLIIFSFLKKIRISFILVTSLFLATQDLVFSHHLGVVLKYVFIFSIFFQLLIWANFSVNLYAERYVRKNMQRDPTALTAIHIFTLIWKIVAFSIIILIMLDQMGFNITTLLAGLGVGGIAVAFALQNILSDIFGSLAIIFDKPFKVGDIIKFNDFTARVEQVGLKTTRLRNVNGDQIVYSNNEILKTTIQNFGKIQDRRAVVTLGVTYETPFEKLEKVPELVRQCIFSQKGTRIDSIMCSQLADSSINFEVIYLGSELSMADWKNIQHNVNMEILRVFNQEGISFAYPTRTVYTKSF